MGRALAPLLELSIQHHKDVFLEFGQCWVGDDRGNRLGIVDKGDFVAIDDLRHIVVKGPKVLGHNNE